MTDDEKRFQDICMRCKMPIDLANIESVKRIIRNAFEHRGFIAEGIFGSLQRPQAYVLQKSLEVLQTYLATQSIPQMIKWARSEN